MGIQTITETSGQVVGRHAIFDSTGAPFSAANPLAVSIMVSVLTFKPLAAVSVATEAAVWTPVAGKKFTVLGAVVSSSVSGNLTFKDGTGLATVLVVPCLAGDPVVLPPLGAGIPSGAINRVLTCTGPATSTLSGFIFGIES